VVRKTTNFQFVRGVAIVCEPVIPEGELKPSNQFSENWDPSFPLSRAAGLVGP
jgi:hypothetical protein